MPSTSGVGRVWRIPSIPDNPDQLLAKGDAYFQRKKYFQSQELYKAFLLRHPGNARSDHVQFMLAESYYEDDEYAFAGVEYRILVSNYGYSDYVTPEVFRRLVREGVLRRWVGEGVLGPARPIGTGQELYAVRRGGG